MQTIDVVALEVATPVIISPSKRPEPHRERLPNERQSITHKFVIQSDMGTHEGYITVGLYEDGRPAEMFVVIAKEGSTLSGLMDAFSTSISLLLQYGVPLKVLADKFAFARYEPSGFTKNPHILIAKSITDYIFRWMILKFGTLEEKVEFGIIVHGETHDVQAQEPPKPSSTADGSIKHSDGTACRICGGMTKRNGTCHVCLNCGNTSGCS